jgi:hypothetical protein
VSVEFVLIYRPHPVYDISAKFDGKRQRSEDCYLQDITFCVALYAMQSFMKSIFFTDLSGKYWMQVDMLIDSKNNKENTNIFQEGFH